MIIGGCFSPWGAAKAVLILATLRDRFTIVLAEAIEREVQRAIANRIASLDTAAAGAIVEGVAGWLSRVRVERYQFPSEAEIRARLPVVLPVLKHVNDLPAVVSAMQARPDWVISANREHWTDELGERADLRIVSPLGFLQEIHVTEG